MRKLLLLTSAIVFFDTLFYAALTPLLPHYAEHFHFGKAGAGALAAAFPAGALVGAIPSGIVTARAGPKTTVIIGLTVVLGEGPHDGEAPDLGPQAGSETPNPGDEGDGVTDLA